MRGHVQQRGSGTWRIKAYVGRDETSAKRYIQQTVKGTRREAERELSRLVVEIDEGRHAAAAAPMTVDELLDRWLAVREPNVEASTTGPTPGWPPPTCGPCVAEPGGRRDTAPAAPT
jgi:hypothetical protein